VSITNAHIAISVLNLPLIADLISKLLLIKAHRRKEVRFSCIVEVDLKLFDWIMALVLGNAYKFYDFYFNEFRDLKTNNLLLVGSPWPIAVIIASYLYFVLNCGPKWMTKRRPFELTSLINIYNVLQIAANFYVVVLVC